MQPHHIITRSNKWNFLTKIWLTLFLISFLSACGPSQEEITNQIEDSVKSTISSIPTSTDIVVVETKVVTEIVKETVVVTATHTPTPINTPTSTPTLGPSPTPTEQPGIGDTFSCGDIFTVKVLKEPSIRKSIQTQTAAGQYMFITFELINNTSSTYESLRTDDYYLIGIINNNSVTFSDDYLASFWWNFTFGRAEKDYNDDVAPGVPWRSTVAFDVNPEGQDWIFVFEPGLKNSCKVEIPLE